MPIPRFSASAAGADVAAGLAAEGCAIIERVVPTSLLDAAERELRPHLDATPAGSDDFAGRRTRRTGGLIARSATCRELVMHPLVLDTVVTSDFTVLGRVSPKEFKIESKYGPLTIQLADVGQMVDSPAGSPLPYLRSGPHGPYDRFWDGEKYWPCQQPP